MIKLFPLLATIALLIPSTGLCQVQFVKTWENSISADSWDVALGDVDNDSDLDVIVANEGTQNSSSVLLLNDGEGNFSVGQQLYESSKAVSFGDFDNDGDKDICLINTNYFIKTWINDGNGSFALSGYQIETHSGIEDIRVGFLDNDTFLDIVVLNLEHPDEIFFNNGDLTFEKSSQELGLSGIDGAGGIELGDLNGDGFTDIFKGNWGLPCAQVWINDGTGYFTELSQSFGNISEHIHGVALCDFDNDSDLDVFLGYSAENIESEIWFNDGNGFFELNQAISLNSSNLVQDICTADFDNDGDHDVFVSTLWGHNALLLNNGAGEFTESQFLFPDIESMASVTGDLDGDEDMDLFITSNTWYGCSGYNSAWINTTPVWTTEIKKNGTMIFPNPTTNIINILNWDGKPDNSWYTLYNMQGILIQEGCFYGSSIDISEQPVGTYYLKLDNGNNGFGQLIINRKNIH